MAQCGSSRSNQLLSSVNSSLLKRIYLRSQLSGVKSRLESNDFNLSHHAEEEIFSNSNLFQNLKDLAAQVEPSQGSGDAQEDILDRLLLHTRKNISAITHSIKLIAKEQNSSSDRTMDEFSCQKCCELLFNPVTLLCGHTFCQHCVEVFGKIMKKCIICNKPLPRESPFFRGNIVLSTVLQKWHPTEWACRSETVKGITHLHDKEFDKAVDCFTKTLNSVPRSHIAYLHRAKAYLSQGKLEKAYQDVWAASYLASTWPEAYYIYGEILFAMRHFEEAVLAFCICLSFDSSYAQAKARVKEILSLALFTSDDEVNFQSGSPVLSKDLFDGNKTQGSPQQGKKRKFEDYCTSLTKLSALIEKSLAERKDVEVAAELENITQCNLHIHPANPLNSDLVDEDQEKENSTEVKKLKKSLLSIAGSLTEVFFHNASHETAQVLNLQIPVVRRKVNPDLLDASDFECILCMRLYYNPVCTPCGHIFCQFCIERCLDHDATCPLCKQSMKVYLAESIQQKHPACDYVTKEIIEEYFPEDFKEREKQHRSEIEEITQSKPIFVCTIAFPSVPCPLHVFEPRYRLMLRRCLDHNHREFGMCMRADDKPHHPIGTLLKVRDVKFFPDGRSVVDSIGYRRFKATDCEVKDGYNVAKYTYIVDKKITDNAELAKLIELCDKVYENAESWFKQLPQSVADRITNHFGAFPKMDEKINEENGPNWLWWVLAVLPVEERVQATILGKDLLKDRLLIIQRVLSCLRQRKIAPAGR